MSWFLRERKKIMCMKCCHFFFLFLFSTVAFSQNFEWVKKGTSRHPTYGHNICTDEGNNVYVTGRFYDTLSFENLTIVEPYAPIYGAGYFVPSDFIAKYSQTGKLVWAFPIGPSSINSIAFHKESGSIYLAGDLMGTVAFGPDTLKNFNYWDGFLAKMDTAGNFIWGRKVTGLSSQWIKGMAVAPSGQIMVAGNYGYEAIFDTFRITTDDSEKGNAFVASYDENGSFLWANEINSDWVYFPEPKAAIADSTGFYLTGGFGIDCTFEGGGNLIKIIGRVEEAFLAKYSFNGELIWAKVPEGTPEGKGQKLFKDYSGNIYLNVQFSYLGKFNTNGGLEWDKSLRFNSITFTPNNEMYMAFSFGETANFGGFKYISETGGAYHAALAKFNTNEDFLWFITANGNQQLDFIYMKSGHSDMVVNRKGEIYTIGSFEGIVNFGEHTIQSDNNMTLDFFITKVTDNYKPISISYISQTSIFCNGSIFKLLYQGDSCLNYNKFYAQLSDENGDFGTAVFIGDTLSRFSGSIECKIPENIKGGSNYKLRVIASNPHTKSNEVSISIKNCSTNIDNKASGSTFKVYPNPNKGSLSISGNFKDPATLKISNISGAIVYLENNFKPKTLNLNLPPGIYLLELQVEKEVLVKKVVVN
jgi:hypothetical protein